MIEPTTPNRDEVSDRERFLSVLNDITYAALEQSNFDELMQLLADRLAEIISADGCYLTLWDEAKRLTIPVAAYGRQRDGYKDVVTEPNQQTLTKTTIESNRTLIIKDAWDSEFALSHISRRFPSRGMLAIPMKASGKNLGAALIAFEKPHDFSPKEVEYCEQAVRQISLAIANARALEALKQSEQNYRNVAEALSAREQHLYEAHEIAKLGSWEWNWETDESNWSEGMYRLLDMEPRDTPPMNVETYQYILPTDQPKVEHFLTDMPPNSETSQEEFRTKSGKYLIAKTVRDKTHKRFTGTLQDVTEQRKLEAELLQARKMEAVGTLAGGIAHNFNNILTVIMGNYELLRSSIPKNTEEAKTLSQCLEATERAALLTRQLLVVSRTQDLNPEPINVNELLTNLIDLLSPLVGEHIHVKTDFHTTEIIVKADRGHLEQVFMNLILNSRDAIGSSGNLSLSTEARGDQVAICVEDDGPGISDDDMPHIFDPFFTTKEVGKGTGLGLATVQSIVQQSRGKIEVDSEPQHGTRITIILPTSDKVESSPSTQSEVETLSKESNGKTILLVEDHESLRSIAIFVLEQAGHEVISAEKSNEALEMVERGQVFDLIVTDVQLPGGLSGPELVEKIFAIREIKPTIFMSGLRDVMPEHPDFYFLPKPFRPAELLEAVNKAVDQQLSR